MFESRLRVLLVVLGGALVILVARLGHLQVVNAEYYRARTARALTLEPTALPFVRGSILDRTGRTLVREIPCWDVTVDYGVIAADVARESDDDMGQKPFAQQVKRWTRARRYADATTEAEVGEAFSRELDVMWSDIAQFTGSFNPRSVQQLRDRARSVHDRIKRVRKAVERRRGFDAPVAEEREPQVIFAGLDAHLQVLAREWFAQYPWVHVDASSLRRVMGDAVPMSHVVGRLGRVDAEDVASDPQADDPFAKYRGDERLGVSGVELLAEPRLRGRRGQLTQDRRGNLIADECFDALNGEDITLTLNAELQSRLYRLLGETVDSVPESSGGSIVVLDVASREVLALVSYPSYDPNAFNESYAELRDDTEYLPLRFRAVANHYPPGSTVKPLTCLAGLMQGVIDLETREDCTGYLLPGVRDKWRCWKIHGTNMRKAHGSVDVVDALTGSCNVFLFRVGERVGVDGLCSAYDMVGMGRLSGIGLVEESRGINPTPSWLMVHRNASVTPGTARNFAIGQGELSMTPLQVANLMATYASGRFRETTLVQSSTEKPEWIIPATAAQWHAIRQGIYNVVNDPNGTAYKHARFLHDRWVLCGKTGSATAGRWPTSYRIPYVDGNGVEAEVVVRAGAKTPAIEQFQSLYPRAAFDPAKVEVATRWPPDPPPAGDKYSHAWFGAFLQRRDASGQPLWSETPPLAFMALVEFGGSGGRTTGPLAKKIAAELVRVCEGASDPGA